MSKSDDNTNELESYGVWVKNTAENDNTELTPADTSDELNLDDGGLDLPDFDDSDFSDMFKEDPQDAVANGLDDFGSEDDTTLSTDELANITGGVDVEEVEAPQESGDDDALNFDDIAPTETNIEEPDADAEISTESDEINFDDIISDSETSEETETSVDTSDFDTEITDETETAVDTSDFDTEIPTEEVTDFNTEISTEAATDSSDEISTEDEEISLDDFMDEGFSDESVASGNNGFEPGAGPSVAAASSETEELSLDDFMDGDSFDSAPEAAKPEETIEDETPLDMDISFDDSADTVETEDNLSLDISADDDDDTDYDTEETESVETEEVSMDDFGSSFTAEETSTPSADSSSENINTEDVDLSDFGIDANAEETPIVQDVEEAKNKEKVVDYDLSVGDENTATAPVVNEIKSDVEEAEEVAEPAAPVAENENKTAVDNSLLQQIVSELSNLKDEMNKLKTNLEEIKHEPAAAAVAAGVAAGAAAAAISNDVEIPEETEEDKGGFFSGDDEDDTIALSFDELDNIMNTADFSDTVEADENANDSSEESVEIPVEESASEETNAEEPITDEPVIEESVITEDEPIIEENQVEIEADEPVDEPAIEEIVAQDTVPLEEENIDDDTIIEESIISSEPEITDTSVISDSTETELENAISSDEATNIEDIDLNEDQNNDSFDFSNEKLEEPEIDEFIPDGNDELFEEESLPDEISIPKEEDLLVESTSSDFMDSVKETTDEEQVSAEITSEENIDEMEIDLPEESEEEITSVTDDDIPTVDKVLSDESEPEVEVETEAEPEIEESFTSVDNFAEETAIEEPVVETPAETTYAEVDNLDNTLSDSNLAYLDKTDAETESTATTDLKQDIKSVLLYMDQLLENLPEEKIVEFAKSDEFVTYKKLFSELGLS